MKILCKAIVFDLDGTLVDSGEVVERSWEQFAIANGFDFKCDILPIVHGRPAIETIKDLMPSASVAKIDELVRQLTLIELNQLKGLKPILGAGQLLAALPSHRWGIATSGVYELASGRLNSAELPIPEVMITADITNNPKPHPEPFLKAIEKLGYAPQDCVIFEDSPAGIRGAIASGATVIAVNLPDEHAAELKPHVMVQDLTTVNVVITDSGWLELNIAK